MYDCAQDKYAVTFKPANVSISSDNIILKVILSSYLAKLVHCELVVHIPTVVSHGDLLSIVAKHSDWLTGTRATEGNALSSKVAKSS